MNVNSSNYILKSNVINKMYYNNTYKSTNSLPKNPMTSGDSIQISNGAREVMASGLDKGTAANTTLYLDNSTFQQIVNFTTDNPDCEWSELGIDDDKRWIVVNGQRFESPLSEAEKTARKRAQYTLLDFLEECKKEEPKHSNKSKEKVEIELNSDGDSITVDNESKNEKIVNLLKNDKVMDMFKSILKSNGGHISLSTGI